MKWLLCFKLINLVVHYTSHSNEPLSLIAYVVHLRMCVYVFIRALIAPLLRAHALCHVCVGRNKPKSSKTTVKPALAIMSSSSASLGIKPERRLPQQNAAVSSRLSSTKLLPEMKKPKIPFRMEFLNMKRQFEDKAALSSLPNSATTSLTNQQQKVEDIALSPVHCSVSKVIECSIIDGGRDTAKHFSPPPLYDGVVASSGSSNGLSPPRVIPVSDSIERTIVARRWEAKVGGVCMLVSVNKISKKLKAQHSTHSELTQSNNFIVSKAF